MISPASAGRCRLAVRAGDGDDLAFEVTSSQFDFADHGDSGLPRLQNCGTSAGTPGLMTMSSCSLKVRSP